MNLRSPPPQAAPYSSCNRGCASVFFPFRNAVSDIIFWHLKADNNSPQRSQRWQGPQLRISD
jgi:hypothetical protein